MLPKPTSREELTTDQLKDWVHWLPEEDASRQKDESDGDYVNRLFSLGVARGLVNEDGETLDIMSMLGYDLRDDNDRRRVEAFLRGDLKDAVLSSKVFESRNAASEKIMLSRLMDISGSFNSSGLRDLANMQALELAVKSVQKNLSEKVGKTAGFRSDVAKTAETLTQATTKLRFATDPGVRKSTERELMHLREELQQSMESLNEHLFGVAQDLVYQQVDLGLGTGQLSGAANVEKFIAEALSQHVLEIQKIEEARDGEAFDLARVSLLDDDVGTRAQGEVDRG
jgi:hypothetical protein